MIPVILSGGSGTRLWPLSRPMFPKQFLPLTSDHSMFQETLMRIADVTKDDPIVIANNDHRFMVAENLHELSYTNSTIVLEEEGRNTAPAIAVASLLALDTNPDAVLFVLPADHTIQNIEAFKKACKEAERLAREDYLVTFGITPDTPNTGYGYIKSGETISDMACQIEGFKEKPNAETAQSYLNEGGYLWNSGMFAFKASLYLSELEKHAPKVLKHAKEAIKNSHQDLDFTRLSSEDFKNCPDISIDYAVMEKTDKGVVVELDASWCDVGSWDALWSVLPQDQNGNVCRGDVMMSHSANSYVYSEHKLVSVIGVGDLVIADTKDALLVAHKDKVADVKAVVSQLKDANRSEGYQHRTIYRPWGHYDSLDRGLRDVVKRITVLPGKKISMQKHEHRSEHWVLVRGTAHVTKDGEEIVLKENQSIYFSQNTVHSLENKTDELIELIEVQTGDHISDDDIVRLENLYNE